jgi:hypothetical protein
LAIRGKLFPEGALGDWLSFFLQPHRCDSVENSACRLLAVCFGRTDLYPNLKLEIFKRGIRQSHMARELGLNEANLSKIIHGYREPSTVVKQLLAGFLGVDMEWLFERYDGNGSAPVSTRGENSPNGKGTES